jgi:replication-associated recombination protein RarA
VEWWILALALGERVRSIRRRPRAFVSELVSGNALSRAIAINSTVASAARMIGPPAGGVLVAIVGVGTCFLINDPSFLGPCSPS